MRGAAIVIAGLAVCWLVGRWFNHHDGYDGDPAFDVLIGGMAIVSFTVLLVTLFAAAVFIERALP